MFWVRLETGALPIGFVLTMVFGLLAALALGQIAAPALQPRLPLLRDLVRNIDQSAGHIPEGTDPAVAEVIRAVNRLAGRSTSEIEAARRDAQIGRAAVAASPNGVLVVGPDGRVRLMNDAFRRMLQVVSPDPVGRKLIEVVNVAEVHPILEACRQGRPVDEVAARVGREDLMLRPVRIDDGVLLIAYDVTRFRRAERARTEFVANVSHELRTPIATIMGYAETLGGDRDRMNEEDAMMADAILRNVRRLRDLFEDLLELSRIESRLGELPRSRERLAPLLELATESAAEFALSREQTLTLTCDEALEASTNPEALGTIVSNLARNATNYTPDGGSIQVTARREGAEVLVEVIDNGIGIDHQHHDRIFERFYRVDVGRSRKVGGTGLGLAIAKHLAAASGCRISVHSEVGNGSRFTVHLQP